MPIKLKKVEGRLKRFCPGIGGNGQPLGERRKEMRKAIATLIIAVQYSSSFLFLHQPISDTLP